MRNLLLALAFAFFATSAQAAVVKFNDAGYNDIRETACEYEASDSCNLLASAPAEVATLEAAWNGYVEAFLNNPESLDAAEIAKALTDAKAVQAKVGGKLYAGIVGVGAMGPLSENSRLSFALVIQVTDAKGNLVKGGQFAVTK